mgnify:CR=1 FL=1
MLLKLGSPPSGEGGYVASTALSESLVLGLGFSTFLSS